MYLLKGGRVTLIKATLHFTSFFHMPRAIARRLEAIEAVFLWGDREATGDII